MAPAPIRQVLETCLYVKSMDNSVAFYKDVLGLQPAFVNPRITPIPIGTTTLILFQLGLTHDDSHPPNNASHTIPGHGPSQNIIDQLVEANGSNERVHLKMHFCLAVESPEEVKEWEQHFKNHNVEITGIMDWEKGGRSVYFADPDGHVGEIGSRGIWDHY